MRPKIFVTQPIADSAVARLREFADVAVNPDPGRILTKTKLIKAVGRSDILLALRHDRIDRDVLAANANLKAVATMAVTPDNIDLAEATARKIPVTLVPAMATEALADAAFALLLSVARRIAEGDRLVRIGAFPGAQSGYLAGSSVNGKTLGLVGYGHVGRAMARRAHGFGMRIVYSDPQRVPEDDVRKYDALSMDLDQLLGEADFVSLHCGLNAETHHLIGARQFALMKRGAYLVNVAHGPIIDEAALVRALEEGRIAGAALDVYEHEPKIAPALLGMDNVVLTPHLGSAVADLRERMAHIVVDNIHALLEGHRPPNCINMEVFAPAETSTESAPALTAAEISR